MTAPNGNTTAFAYDALGHLASKDTTAAGPVNRALYDFTYNRAGVGLTEAATITGGASNGTVTYGYDPLGWLAGSTLSGTTTAYGWDAATNRTAVQVGSGTPATTAYDAANRPTSGADPSATYTSDADGRLTAGPGYQGSWDHLGRLTQVRDGSGVTLATYTYDPLDRLRTVDHGGSNRVRFRYVGMTTAAAQWLDDGTGTIIRSVATGWGGERLAEWDPAVGTTTIAVHGTNAHHDVTWLAGSTGSVTASLRYDPWGTPRTSAPAGYTPFRFQGSWTDDTTGLAWVVTRWYAPALGRFLSEDTLLGDPADPPSRHLYAYAQGEPIGRWDPDGRKEVFLTHVPLLRVVTGRGSLTWQRDQWRPDANNAHSGESKVALVTVTPPRKLARDYRGWMLKTRAGDLLLAGSNDNAFGITRIKAQVSVALLRWRGSQGWRFLAGKMLIDDWQSSAGFLGSVGSLFGAGGEFGDLFRFGPWRGATIMEPIARCSGEGRGVLYCPTNDRGDLRKGDLVMVVSSFYIWTHSLGAGTGTGRLSIENWRNTLRPLTE